MDLVLHRPGIASSIFPTGLYTRFNPARFCGGKFIPAAVMNAIDILSFYTTLWYITRRNHVPGKTLRDGSFSWTEKNLFLIVKNWIKPRNNWRNCSEYRSRPFTVMNRDGEKFRFISNDGYIFLFPGNEIVSTFKNPVGMPGAVLPNIKHAAPGLGIPGRRTLPAYQRHCLQGDG